MIGLVSCSSSKLNRAAKARDLYTSPLFRASLAYAERHCSRVYVVSALHGLVELYQQLQPYNFQLGERRKTDRKQWASVIAARLIHRHGREVPYVILAGALYANPISQELRTHDGYHDDGWRGARDIRAPLRGMRIGERLSWLRQQAGGAQ
ncbi:MAG: DUF6884 domain-containing protein [Kofleriaceae bacterium]